MKKILVPVDFSKPSEYAMNFAVEFCKRIDGEIILMHVLESPSSGFNSMGEVDTQDLELLYQGEFIKAVHNKLASWKAQIADLDVQVSSHIVHGNAFQSISKMIAAEGVDLIIMGSKGASGLKEAFIGSIASKTVRHAKCPVIIIKEKTHIEDFKSLVFATDASIEQDALANEVKHIQELLGLNLQILKVKTPYSWLEESQVDSQLSSYSVRNSFENYTINTLDADYVDEGAIKFAEEMGAGMVLIGTHGRTGFGHLIGGSIAESIVNESKIPILVFKLESKNS